MTLPDWTREPLVQFLFGGAVLFAALSWIGEPVDPADRSITIDREQQAQLALQFERTLQRPPTDAELDTLIEQYVREEVLYREALRLGLDSDDAIVRRRMAQKMDGLAASKAEIEQPGDAVLQAWLEKYPSRFATDSRLSFDQLWFAQKSDAETALARLRAGTGWQGLGERIDLPASRDDAARRNIEARFGRQFASQLDELETGEEGHGPLPSGFGFHLVRLRERDAGSVPPLAEIRSDVENDWRSQTMAARKDAAYKVLRDAYEVDVER